MVLYVCTDLCDDFVMVLYVVVWIASVVMVLRSFVMVLYCFVMVVCHGVVVVTTFASLSSCSTWCLLGLLSPRVTDRFKQGPFLWSGRKSCNQNVPVQMFRCDVPVAMFW